MVAPQPRHHSPSWTPSPLPPSPWNTPRFSPVSAPAPDRRRDAAQTAPGMYLSTVARPLQDPHEILHDLYNVAPIPFQFEVDGSVPLTVEMPLLRRSDSRPTHALAVLSSLTQPVTPTRTLSVPSEPTTPIFRPPSPSSPSSPYSPVPSEPFLLPVDVSLFSARFGHDTARSLASAIPLKQAKPIVRRDRSTGVQLITLPLIPLYVPHPPSVPHILLFGQGLSFPPARVATPNYSRPTTPRPPPSPSTLATYLLPIRAIEEFPSAPSMADVMARQCTEEALRDYVVFNQGLWRNVLLLAPKDPIVVDIARVAWNVAAEARRLRDRNRMADSISRLTRSPTTRALELPAVHVQYIDASNLRTSRETIHLAPVPLGKKPLRRRSEKNLNGHNTPGHNQHS